MEVLPSKWRWRDKTVLAQSAFKKHMCFFVLFFDQPLFYVLFCAFFFTSRFFMCFFVLFFGLKVLFFPDFREIMIKMVIFVHFKYFKRNISELSLR